MSINLNQLVQGALTESVLEHIAGRIGCAPESARRVVSLCGPALIGAMMNKASSLEGARQLFASIMSPATNAKIAEELPHFVVRDDEFKSLVESGAKVDHTITSRDSLNLLAERIAEYTGVAASATRTLTGVVAATLFGLLKRHFSQHNGHSGQLPTLLGHQLPVVRANMTDAFARALGLGAVGSFVAGVASRLKAVSAHLEHPATHEAAEFPLHPETSVAAEPPVAENACRKKWWWIALAAALALLAVLLGRGCSTEKSKPVSAPAAAPDSASGAVSATAPAAESALDTRAASAAYAGSAASFTSWGAAANPASAPDAQPGKNSTMSFTVDTAGVPRLSATVNSEQEKQRLIDALTAKFGADKFDANITVDPDTKPAAWLAKLDGLLPVIALPGAQARIEGENIDLGGSATDAKLGWLDRLRAYFGDGWTIGATAAPASDAGNANAVACDNAVSNLSAHPITFGFASDSLPGPALDQLAQAAKSLKDCHAAGKAVKLQIGGFTDSSGDPGVNIELSQKRAQAVRTYLIRHGVPANTLTAEGFGDAHPVADNATAAGRAANRRIEFKELS
ncbi:OmpA/MotB domain-containing protein [Caballeronia hypogeia]|uniref:OmpA/MotB domain-containing protein n=1 Tax=Caballeronia hypogeia TaxID=1777140 RepID=A0A158DDY1_9BURK|nr:OmpA family protein [Caballeronia hypogeia]SAK92842.1 OmpA/MotB domain-containing protein [Caballeronia hypogeia]